MDPIPPQEPGQVPPEAQTDQVPSGEPAVPIAPTVPEAPEIPSEFPNTLIAFRETWEAHNATENGVVQELTKFQKDARNLADKVLPLLPDAPWERERVRRIGGSGLDIDEEGPIILRGKGTLIKTRRGIIVGSNGKEVGVVAETAKERTFRTANRSNNRYSIVEDVDNWVEDPQVEDSGEEDYDYAIRFIDPDNPNILIGTDCYELYVRGSISGEEVSDQSILSLRKDQYGRLEGHFYNFGKKERDAIGDPIAKARRYFADLMRDPSQLKLKTDLEESPVAETPQESNAPTI